MVGKITVGDFVKRARDDLARFRLDYERALADGSHLAEQQSLAEWLSLFSIFAEQGKPRAERVSSMAETTVRRRRR